MRRLEIIVSRLAWFVPTMLGLLVLIFTVSHIIPTDPVRVLLGENASMEQVEALRVELGFDRPLWVQFLSYIRDVATGNMGDSLFTRRPIAETMWERLPATLELTLAAVLLAVVVGIPLGVLSALRRNSVFDHVLRVLTVSGLAVASFWLAMELQFLFSMRLGWAPLNGRVDGFGPEAITGFMVIDSIITGDMATLGTVLSHLALPALTLALPAAATIVRFTRAGVLEVINSNFVLYERAMGIPWPLIVWKYVLRNALISTVTQIGLIFGLLLSGAVVVETVFDWPGLGAYAVNSILQSDYKAIMGFTIWTGAMFVIVNLLVDILHTVIDPRTGR
jgi:peptide/nickel transport system permease protein